MIIIKYAFYVQPDDIHDVLNILRDAGAKWTGYSKHEDFMEEAEDIIRSHKYDKNGMAAYIWFRTNIISEHKMLVQYSSIEYLLNNAESVSNEGYNIVDNLYLIPELSMFIQYDELGTNNTNFFDI